MLDLDEMQSLGASAVARAALEHVSAGPDGYWVHLDLDVLDNAVMPAVDSPQPGGLPPDQLVLLLGELLASDLAYGVDVTIYDPELDPDGSCGALVTDTLEKALGTGRRGRIRRCTRRPGATACRHVCLASCRRAGSSSATSSAAGRRGRTRCSWHGS